MSTKQYYEKRKAEVREEAIKLLSGRLILVSIIILMESLLTMVIILKDLESVTDF